LETRYRRDNDVERNFPCGGILGSRNQFDVIASSELEELAQLETAFCYNGMIFFLARVEVSEISLSLRARSELS